MNRFDCRLAWAGDRLSGHLNLAADQNGGRPEVESLVRISQFILSDHEDCRRILMTSPVANCPRISPRGTSAPTRSGSLKTLRPAQSQVK